MSPINTHHRIDQTLCGRPMDLKEGFSRVELVTTSNMAADDSGLIHGGFIFGLADYAAMIAVNHPNVVLGGAEVKFLKPGSVNEKLTAEAQVESVSGKKYEVRVTVNREEMPVFSGIFTCFVLDKHVLESS